MRKAVFYISFLTIILAAIHLLTGSRILISPIHEPNNLLAGTIIAWLGIIALSAFSISSNESIWRRRRHGKWYYFALIISLFFGLSWGFISYSLSGKWNFTFRGDSPTFQGSAEAGELFWIITEALLILPIALLVFYTIHSAIIRRVG